MKRDFLSALSRRQLLGAGAAMGTALALPRRAVAGPSVASGADRKFLFVYAGGGWDPTRVFADGLDNGNVDMEPGAERGTAGNLSFVDAEDRPSVRSFFERHHDQTVLLNGVLIRSIAHEICTLISMTGTTSGLVPDWPAILAAATGDRYVLPHLVLGGPSFPGDLGESVVRAGGSGQLDALLGGDILTWSDTPLEGLGAPANGILDNYLRRRAAARADGAKNALSRQLGAAYAAAVDKGVALKDLRYSMDFSGGSDLPGVGGVALQALSQGLARCATVAYPVSYGGEWDTHTNNDALQSPLWEGLFAGLLDLMAQMELLPGEAGGSLADETVLVVLSEMGRTPQLNPLEGKDHWPYTSMMIVGAGVAGDRVVGGYDDQWYGEPVDPSSGELSESGQILSAEAVGATLMALGGVDPAAYVSGVESLDGILA